jgi:nitroimidazol reductase NimA-like FMN-containing flavoprotein (pyridoxamine 5'-phosphate oxidase superfamily)
LANFAPKGKERKVTMNKTSRSKVRRVPNRAHYDKETIFRILDDSQVCHIAFIHQKQPVSIPTIFGRNGDKLFIHGAMASRLLLCLQDGFDICVSVAHVDGLVLARSAFHHSIHYRSVVVFGRAIKVVEDEKPTALKAISDHLMPGRWEEVRKPSTDELKSTLVLKISIDEASAKIRQGGPKDDKKDENLDIWAGEIPMITKPGEAISDTKLRPGVPVPKSVIDYFAT